MSSVWFNVTIRDVNKFGWETGRTCKTMSAIHVMNEQGAHNADEVTIGHQAVIHGHIHGSIGRNECNLTMDVWWNRMS